MPDLERTGRTLRGAASFVRLSALGGTLILPLLGAAAAGPVAAGDVGRLLLVGLAFHVFAYVLNDVVDLPVDRTEARRVHSPLVRGTIGRAAASVVAGVQVPIALLLAADRGWAAVLLLSAAFVLLAVYDLRGKRSTFPPLVDVAQGLGWGCLCAYGSVASGRWSAVTTGLFVFVVVFIVMANGVHGALRDIFNDSRCGVRSTAIVLGATAVGEDEVRVPPVLRRYATGLHVALLVVVAAMLIVDPLGLTGVQRLTTACVAGVSGVAATWLLTAAARTGSVAEVRPAGMAHLLAMLMLPMVVVWYRFTPPMRVGLLAVFLVPLLAHGWLPSLLRWTWRTAVRWPAAQVRRTS